MITNPRPTRVLFCSYSFHPSIGGIETVGRLLAERLVQRGCDLQVVTNIPADADGQSDSNQPYYPFPVHRRPGIRHLLRLVRWSDLVFHNNISLHYAWPLLLFPRPLVVTNQTPIEPNIEKSALKRKLKFLVLRMSSSVSVSHFLASTLPSPSTVIYNPFRENTFVRQPSVVRNKQLLFVGRLTGAKGVDVLLRALALLRDKGVRIPLTLVGSGPDEQALKALANHLSLDGQVDFVGPREAADIARIMNEHEVIAVPSRVAPAEALGVVAVEAIACGTVPVVAAQGGLPEAIGSCGLTFECENPQSLSETLEIVLADSGLRDRLRRPAREFLRKFDEESIVNQYLQVFSTAMGKGKLTFSEKRWP